MAARYFRLQIRNAADTADALVLSSYPADTYPYLTGPPSGDGQRLDPATGRVDIGTYTVQAADAGSVITAALVDGDGRQTLVHRRAYIRQSTDGVTWTTVLLAGYINGYRLVDAITWEFTIGESQRVEQMRRVFDRTSTNFDKVTCLFGGPVKGGWGPLRDYGGWVFKVTAVDANLVTLQFVEGFIPVTDVVALWGWARNALSDWSRERVNRVIFNDPKTIINGITVFDDLTVEVQQLDGTLVDRFTPALQVDLNVRLFDFSGALTKLDKLQVLRVDTPWQATPPSVNDEFRLYLWREVISDENPLHIDAHPVDVVTDLWTDAGVPYDTTAAASVRAALGDRTRLTLRITQGYQLQDFLQDVIFGAFGIAARRGTDGEMELYVARVRNLSAPSNTYDLTDLRNPDTVIFELDEGSIYNTVIVEQEVYAPWSPSSGQPRATDDIIPVKITAVVELDSDGDGTPDSATEGPRELRFTIPGCVRLAESGFDELPLFIAQGIAAEVFDRFGKGGVFGTIEALPDLTEQTGQELILNVAHLPNAGVRGGARVLQVVQRTETPAGPAIRLLDSGPNSQFATSPTFSVAANAGKPKKVVDVTVTNQGALQTAEAWLRVEWSVAASQPAGNGSLLVTYQPADLPAAFQLPAVDAGSRVWIRMQAFRPGMRATAWTAWQDVNLADLTAPSALAQAQDPTDDGITEVSWTLGESDIPVELYQRPQGDPAGEARLVDLLAAGSDRLRLKLAPGSSFTIGVRHREASPFAGVSATTEISFTVAGSIPTLTAPTISAFSIVKNRDIELFNWFPLDTEAVIGVCLRAAVLPSYYEIEMATETAIGSGTPGSYSLVQTLAASVEDSEYRTTQPIDGKYRYFRVRHIREGANPSGYSEVVSALPGWAQACDLPVPSFDIEPGEMQVGRYDFIGALASDPVITTRVSGDTVARLSVRADGMQEWGPGGAAALDTNLYRSAANTLRTDDALIVAGLLSPLAGIALTGTLLIGGDANLYRTAADTLKTDDALHVSGLLSALAGIALTGTLTIGGDANLYRSGANALTTDDALTLAGLLTAQAGLTVSGGPIAFPNIADPGIGGYKSFVDTADAHWKFRSYVTNSGNWAFQDWSGSAWQDVFRVRSGTGTSVDRGTFTVELGLATLKQGLTVSGGSISASGIATTVGALTATTGTFSGKVRTTVGGAALEAEATTPELILFNTAATTSRLRVLPFTDGRVWFQVGADGTSGSTADLTFSGMLGTPVHARLTAGGNFLLGTGTPATGSPRLDVVGGGAARTLVLSDITTDVTDKFGGVTVRHYTNAQLPFTIIHGVAQSTRNLIRYGGGSTANVLAATLHEWYTAGTTTTTASTATLAMDLTGVGTASLLYTRGDLRIGDLGRFDSTDQPLDLQLLVYHGSPTSRWQAESFQLLYSAGDTRAQVQSDGTTVAYLLDDPGTGADSPAGAPPTPTGTPVLTQVHKAMTVDITAIVVAYSPPADFRYWEVRVSTDNFVANDDQLCLMTGAKVVHGRLDTTTPKTYYYRVRAVDRAGNTSGYSSTASAVAVANDQVSAFGALIASEISVTSLAAINANIGIVTAGQMRNAGNTAGVNLGGAGGIPAGWTTGINFEVGAGSGSMTRYVDFAGSGTDYFIYSASGRFRVRHNGEILMYGATNQMFELASDGSAFWLANNGDTAGILIQGGNESWWTRYLNVGGGTAFLKHDKLELLYDGTAKFTGKVDITSAQLAQTLQDFHLLLRDPDVAHGMTSQVETDILGAIGFIDASAGGLNLHGWSDDSTKAMQFIGATGAGPSTGGVFYFEAWKKNGTTRQAIADSERLIAFANGGTVQSWMLGDGTFVGALNATGAFAGDVAALNSLQFDYVAEGPTGTQNNWTPATGWAPVMIMTGGTTVTFTGFSATGATTPSGTGRLFILLNQSAFTVTLNHNNGGSSAGNRIYCAGAADITMAQYTMAIVYYNPNDSFWYASKVQ